MLADTGFAKAYNSDNMDTQALAKKIRLHALRMTQSGKSSHIGSMLSIADIAAVLYGSIMRFEPRDPKWPERDRCVLSKGHAGGAIYAALAESGFFPIEQLDTYYQDGSHLAGHLTTKGVPGVEFSTGSLGHGLSVATGMAYSAKLDNRSHRVFAILSDGECDEGSNWEAILFAAHHRLDNLTAIVDYNKIQSLASVKDTLGLEPFREKWESFGWVVHEIDGHDHKQLASALASVSVKAGKPQCILAHTIKGKGVSFMEHAVLWHYRSAQGAEYESARQELERQ